MTEDRKRIFDAILDKLHEHGLERDLDLASDFMVIVKWLPSIVDGVEGMQATR